MEIFGSQGNQLPRALYRAGKAQFHASRRGKEVLNYSRERKKKACTVEGRGDKSLVIDHGSESREREGERKSAKKVDEQRKKKKMREMGSYRERGISA